MFALKLYWETTRMIIAVINQKGGTGKTTVATNSCGIDNSHPVPRVQPQPYVFQHARYKNSLDKEVYLF
jgi:hypothetical protein